MGVTRPRRFCFVTTFYPPASFGGDGIFVRNLAHELVRRGHEVEVVHNADAYRLLGGEAHPAPEELPGLTVHALGSGLGPLGPLLLQQTGRPLGLGRKLAAILRPGRFDVVHFHNVSLIGGPAVLALGDGVKLYTTHEQWLICPTHTLFRFNREPCERRTCVACTLAYRRPPQLWRATAAIARAARHVDAFIAPSAAVAEVHRRHGLALPFVEIPNFVGTDGPAPSAARESDGRPYFLFAGRLERLKGVAELLPVFARLREADLVVAGAGSEEAKLRGAASENVRFTGWLQAAELRSLYRGAVAVVVPSFAFEVFPLVVAESLLEGTPLVVPRRGSLPELVERSGGGLVYEDEAGLEQALRALLDDPALRDRLGAAGRSVAESEWSAEAHLRRYFALIERIEAEKRRA